MKVDKEENDRALFITISVSVYLFLISFKPSGNHSAQVMKQTTQIFIKKMFLYILPFT